MGRALTFARRVLPSSDDGYDLEQVRGEVLIR
jgi:hypothetical protein